MVLDCRLKVRCVIIASLKWVFTNHHIGSCIRSIVWHILIWGIHLINSIIHILFTEASCRRGLNISLVELESKCIGGNYWAIISGVTVIVVCHLKLWTIFTALLLVIKPESTIVYLLNCNGNLPSMWLPRYKLNVLSITCAVVVGVPAGTPHVLYVFNELLVLLVLCLWFFGLFF